MEMKVPTFNRRYFWVTIMLLCFVTISVAAGVVEKYYYSSTIGSKTTQVEWKLEKLDLWKLTWKEPNETVVTWHNPSLAVLKCLISRPAEGTLINVERVDDFLMITGALRGQTIDKKLSIDHLPWYQAISVSLRPFILSNDDSLEFWILRTDTLRAYKIRALKTSEEFLKCSGQSIKAQKIRLSLTGILSFIGESYYWFKSDDGVFMKYVGPATLHSQHQIIVELQQRAHSP